MLWPGVWHLQSKQQVKQLCFGLKLNNKLQISCDNVTKNLYFTTNSCNNQLKVVHLQNV